MNNTATNNSDTMNNASADSESVLVVTSKVKNYIRGKSQMNTAGTVAPKLSEMVRKMCDQAISRAQSDGRKTVMDRDFETSCS